MSQARAEFGRKPIKERTKLPDDALPRSVMHWIKVESLAILNEGEFSAGEVAIMLGEDVKNVRNHLRELYEAGSIELAGYKKVGGYVRAVYRAGVPGEFHWYRLRAPSRKPSRSPSDRLRKGILMPRSSPSGAQ